MKSTLSRAFFRLSTGVALIPAALPVFYIDKRGECDIMIQIRAVLSFSELITLLIGWEEAPLLPLLQAMKAACFHLYSPLCPAQSAKAEIIL